MNCRKLLQMIVLPTLLFFSQIAFAQDHVITGRVTDSTGAGVAGVTVTAKGSRIATQTGADGTFSIKVPSSVTSLVFTSVGMTTQEMPISGRSSLNVSMNGTPSSMNEVVVIGYGTKLKKDLTSSIASVTEKDFNKGAIVTPEQLITGKVAGVQITSNGGAPGSGSSILIRGGTSLGQGGASNSPLIVIDGVPLDFTGISGTANAFSLINPNDIESFSVLKDAAAASIYGSRAANGVIIITTKKGKTGKAKFNFNSKYSVSTPYRTADVLSADEFRAFVKKYGTSAQIGLMGGVSTDWQDQIFENAPTFDNNISVSGTFKSLPYRVSLGYLNQQGMLRTGYLKRKTASLNLNPSLFNKRLKLDFQIKGSMENNRFANEGSIGSAASFDPTQSVYGASKRYGGFWEWLDPTTSTGLRSLAPRNPVGLLEQRLDLSEVKRSIGNLQLDYKLSQYLHVVANMGYDVSRGEGTVYVPDSAASAYRRYFDAATNTFHGGINNQYQQTYSQKLWENYLNYARDFNSIDSKFEFLIGYSYQDNTVKSKNYPDVTTDGTIVSTPAYPTSKGVIRLSSFFSRLTYTLKNKYIIQGTIRRDGSSRFSEDNRWGWFPGVSVAWKLKEEDFLKNSSLFSDLKLRGGYGVTGQQNFSQGYLALYTQGTATAEYQFGSNYYTVLRPDGYNPNLQWEETKSLGIGIDFGFLKNRLTGSIDVYDKKTSKLLNAINQSAGTNFSNIVVANVGDMENKGVELTLNGQIVRRRSLSVDAGFNVSYNHNEITKLTIVNDPTYIGNQFGGISGGTGNTIFINSVGFPRGSFYVYQQVYDAKGNPVEDLFVDRNGDGQITDKDLYKYKRATPDVFLGAYSNASWKKWNGGFSLRASFGNYMYNNRNSSTGTQRNILNPLNYLNNGSVDVLKTGFVGGGSRYFLSDYYVENASFLRMDNIFVGYNAGNWLSKTTNLSIAANVQNVFVVTKYDGVDPEIGSGIDNNFYPRPRIFILSINLDF
jgi:TonB-linked SusC/RagA family outer membrane protein